MTCFKKNILIVLLLTFASSQLEAYWFESFTQIIQDNKVASIITGLSIVATGIMGYITYKTKQENKKLQQANTLLSNSTGGNELTTFNSQLNAYQRILDSKNIRIQTLEHQLTEANELIEQVVQEEIERENYYYNLPSVRTIENQD